MMQVIRKSKALELLNRSIEESSNLTFPGSNYEKQSARHQWETWIRTLLSRSRAIYPVESQHMQEIEVQIRSIQDIDSLYTRQRPLGHLVAVLGAYATEIEELWSDHRIEEEDDKAATATGDATSESGTKVFVVHGHDHGTMQGVARFIEQLGLDAVILHEQSSGGDTIIEKLEAHGQVDYCVVLLTPDDVGATKADQANLRARARQNVVLELGYFMGRLGRRKTCALVAGGLEELPSDYSGVVYINIDKEDAWKIHLAKELRNAGLPVDANKILE